MAPTFNWPEPVKRGEAVTFVAADQSNSECTIVDYAWDFDGDGTAEQRGQRVNYTFESDGRHTVELTVENSRGIEKTVSRELVVVFDPDGGGVTSVFERARGLDPRDADIDEDLFTDGIDPAPTSLLFPTGLLQGTRRRAVRRRPANYRGVTHRSTHRATWSISTTVYLSLSGGNDQCSARLVPAWPRRAIALEVPRVIWRPRRQVIELCPFEPTVAVGGQLPPGTVMSPQFETRVWLLT